MQQQNSLPIATCCVSLPPPDLWAQFSQNMDPVMLLYNNVVIISLVYWHDVLSFVSQLVTRTILDNL